MSQDQERLKVLGKLLAIALRRANPRLIQNIIVRLTDGTEMEFSAATVFALGVIQARERIGDDAAFQLLDDALEFDGDLWHEQHARLTEAITNLGSSES